MVTTLRDEDGGNRWPVNASDSVDFDDRTACIEVLCIGGGKTLLRQVLRLIVGGLAFQFFPGVTAQPLTFPKVDPAQCDVENIQLFDPCRDQMSVFEEALEVARSQDKVLLVSVGADWCIWCHVLDKYLNGESGKFRYNLEGERITLNERAKDPVELDASALRELTAENFVIVHIEWHHNPSGEAVVDRSGSWDGFIGEIPFVFAVDEQGNFLRIIDTEKAETRRDGIFDWYRGYDRKRLLAELEETILLARE